MASGCPIPGVHGYGSGLVRFHGLGTHPEEAVFRRFGPNQPEKAISRPFRRRTTEPHPEAVWPRSGGSRVSPTAMRYPTLGSAKM